jgi:hypothetical protein
LPQALQKVLQELYLLVRREGLAIGGAGGTSDAGHTFEDTVSRRIHALSKDLGFQSTPARHTLELPTLSGTKHQIDCSFNIAEVSYLVECKRRKASAKDQIHYFNSVIADYTLGLRLRNAGHLVKGIFLSTAPVDDNSLAYSLAYGLAVIDPAHPPIEFLVAREKDESLKRAIVAFGEKVPPFNPLHRDRLNQEFAPETLLREYKFLLSHVKMPSGG